jgi:DNA-binding MarR family transcriptional regulator
VHASSGDLDRVTPVTLLAHGSPRLTAPLNPHACICTYILAAVFPSAAIRLPATAPQGCTCARLRRLTRRITAVYDRELAAAGLRVTQFSLLGTLLRDGVVAEGLPMAELAERMDMDRTTLTRNLKPLVDRGWVRLSPDPSDARVRRARISADGQAVFAVARPHWRRAQEQVNRTLGEPAVAELHDWLDAVTPAFRPGADET